MVRSLRLLVLVATALAGLAPPAVAQPVPALSDTLLDFGLVPFPFSQTRDLTIYNAGDQQLIIIDVFAENWVDFVPAPRSGGIPPGDSLVVTVTYYPREIGPDFTTISISWWWDSVFDTLSVEAYGEGTVNSPRIAVDKDSVSAIVPTNLTGEDVVTITNVGGGLLSWTATEDETWITIFPTEGVKAWGLSDELHIQMHAGTRPPGTYDGIVTINSDDLTNPAVEVAVQMTIAPRPIIDVDDRLQFNTVFLGIPKTLWLFIHNAGVIPLEVSDIVPSGPELDVAPRSPTIAPSDTRRIDVTLTPTVVGPYSGTLTINSNDPDDPVVIVDILATVSDNPPTIVLPTDTIEVTLPWMGTETRSVTIGNTGDFLLTWTAIDTVSWVEVVPSNSSVTPGNSYDIDVNFNADIQASDYATDIRFHSNDPVTPDLYVPVVMHVLPTRLIGVSETTVTFNARFVGLDETRTVTITNVGNDTLSVTGISVTDPNFSVGATPSTLLPQEWFDLDVTFAPLSEGPHSGALVIENNSENDDSVVVDLFGEGIIALQLAIAPDSLADSLAAAAWTSRTVSITNPGVRMQPVRVSAFSGAPSPSPPASPSPAVRSFPTPAHEPWESAGTLASAGGARKSAPAPALPAFFENFEDIDFYEWQVTAGAGVKEVVSEGANSIFAYRESASPAGHSNGIYLELPDVQPREMSFWVKPGQSDKFANYVTVRDTDGREVIFFFATSAATFYVNASTGGDQSYPYIADTWHFVEFRDIDWGTKTFDYYVGGMLVKADISFRNPSLIDEFARVDLYSFSSGATAWWDNVWIDWGAPPSWLTFSPALAVIDSMETDEIDLRFQSTGLAAGTHEATIALRTNNAVDALVVIPVVLEVDAVVSDAEEPTTPLATALHQNFPNPFNPSTTIAYDISTAADVTLVVYDVTGARVRTLVTRALPAGRYTATWDGTDERGQRVASGIYFYELQAGSFERTRKMVLLK